MNRIFKCACGGTAWINRELDQVIIQCDRCQASVGGFTLTEIRQEWQHRYGVKAKDRGAASDTSAEVPRRGRR